MNRLTVSVLGLASVFGIGSAIIPSVATAEQTVTIPADTYKAIIERLDTLQKRVEQLESKPKEAAASGTVKKQIDDLYDAMDRVETKTLKDRLNLGAEIRTRVDNFYDKNYMTPLGETRDHNDNHWSSRFRINMDAEISKELLFHGRLAVTKNWADSDNPFFYTDFNRGHAASSTNVNFERAYVDWTVPNMPVPLAITFGRQPSTEGPPVEFRENRPRQSTYPSLLFDGEADGIVATVGLERYIGWKDSGLRFAYGKGYQDDDDFANYRDSGWGLKDTNLLGVFFESQVPSLSNSLMVFSYVRAWDMVDMPMNASVNLGDMDIFGAHVQAQDIMKSGFDAFLSFGMDVSHPNGKTALITFNGQPLFRGGLLSNDGRDSKTGWALYAGLVYTMPFEMLNNPKLGFEYNHGSKDWFSFTQSSIEFYNKLATRGNVYDFYYIQPFNKNLFARFGYTYIDYNYTFSGIHVGSPQKSDETLQDVYMLLDCKF
ncbi:MAG: DUF3373 family protein [Dissulfuribacterales bacterium]